MPIGQSDTDQSDPITLLYMVEAGNHDIVVVVDPDNNIVETDENNNIESIGNMKSPLGAIDVGREVVVRYSVPVIIVGAIIAALSGSDGVVFSSSSIYGFLAIILAAVNIFGGFLVTQRMLAMYKKKKKDK